jgi:hypothetical protein
MVNKLIGRTEVAGIINVHPTSINRIFAAQNGPSAIKVGTRDKFRESDVRAWLDKQGAS